jgi:hypothetical protein
MNRGAIAHFAGDSGEADDSDFPKTRREKGQELRSAVQMRDGRQTGLDAFADGGSLVLGRGRAAIEDTVDATDTRIRDDGTIRVEDTGTDIVTETTEFLHLEDEFIVTESTEDDFAYDLVEEATGGTIVDTELDLGEFAEEHPDVSIWLEGFYDRDGGAEKGVYIGDLDEDADAREIIEEAKINRLGIEEFTWNGRSLNFLITRTGYVDIYDSSVDTMEFVQFLHEIVIPHATD